MFEVSGDLLGLLALQNKMDKLDPRASLDIL